MIGILDRIRQGLAHAWLLAQHAAMQLDFQRRVLGLLTAAVAAGEATPRQLAYLTDRVRLLEGREQICGTRLIGDEEGRLVLFSDKRTARPTDRTGGNPGASRSNV
jgi:hypothetical protein